MNQAVAIYSITGERPDVRPPSIKHENGHHKYYDQFEWSVFADLIAGEHSPLRGGGYAVQAIIGTRPDGSASLFLLKPQLQVITTSDLPSASRVQFFEHRYTRTADLLSLSPVEFPDKETLERIFNSKIFNPKIKKSKNRRGGGDWFEIDLGPAAFEHSRLLYHLLTQPYLPLSNYGSPDIQKESLVLISLAVNVWNRDTRSPKDQCRNPELLDIAWTVVNLFSSGAPAELGETKRFVLDENKNKGQGGGKKALNPITNENSGSTTTIQTQILKRTEIATHIQSFFSSLLSSGKTLIVLSHSGRWDPNNPETKDVDMTLSAMQSFGVDASKWEKGLAKLFGRGDPTKSQDRRDRSKSPPRRGKYEPGHRGPKQEDYYAASAYKRRHSPPSYPYSTSSALEYDALPYDDVEHYDRKPAPPYTDPRARSYPKREDEKPPRPPTRPSEVYYVDIKHLYRKCLATSDGSQHTFDMARRMKVQSSETFVDEDGDFGWCAGTESRVVYEVWKKMASGPPIPMYRLDGRLGGLDLEAGAVPKEEAPVPAPTPAAPGAAFDPMQALYAVPTSAPKASNPYDLLDEDWGEDDDDDDDSD